MKRLPVKAAATAIPCTAVRRSLSIINEKSMEKKGDILLSIEASERLRWSTA